MTGEDLKHRRLALGLTQAELAEAISTPAYRIAQSEISRWERGAVRITPIRASWLDERLRTLEAASV